MTVNIGVIGTGMIGQDHIRRLTQVLSGHSPGDKVSVRVARRSGVTTVDVMLGQRPVSLTG